MIDLTYLKQWSEPDGDNDQLFGVRMEVKSLIREYEKSQEKLEAAKSVVWIAEQFADCVSVREEAVQQAAFRLAQVMTQTKEILKS